MTLARELAESIKTLGAMTVAEYMGRCNTHYYGTRDPFGTKGDFTTAPEISQIFGELIGAWIASGWQQAGAPRAVLCEAGPGRGTLMKDALRATRNVPGFHDALDIRLIETSPVLQAIQKQTLKESHSRITWHGTLAALPALPLFLIANEFFDALPVEQYVLTEAGWEKRRIDYKDGAFIFVPEGEAFIREESPASLAVITQLAGHIRRFGGAALIIDYGYTDSSLPKGEAAKETETLQAVRQHAFANALESPGEIDLTAHVNFTALAQAAQKAGAFAHGPVDQGNFLRRLGAELRATALYKSASQPQREAILLGLERLIAPHRMGELFKVLAMTSSLEVPAGF